VGVLGKTDSGGKKIQLKGISFSKEHESCSKTNGGASFGCSTVLHPAISARLRISTNLFATWHARLTRLQR
jgi:hypothetical protein